MSPAIPQGSGSRSTTTSWAAVAIAGLFAVTSETASPFERPVKLGRDHGVRGWIDCIEGRLVRAGAEIVDARARRCVTAAATFTGLDQAQASDAAGTCITGDAATYTYGSPAR